MKHARNSATPLVHLVTAGTVAAVALLATSASVPAESQASDPKLEQALADLETSRRSLDGALRGLPKAVVALERADSSRFAFTRLHPKVAIAGYPLSTAARTAARESGDTTEGYVLVTGAGEGTLPDGLYSLSLESRSIAVRDSKGKARTIDRVGVGGYSTADPAAAWDVAFLSVVRYLQKRK